MYQRPYTRVEDVDSIRSFVEEYNFGMVITENPLQVTQLPLLLEVKDTLWTIKGHFARANAHWKTAEGEVLLVFNGPHGYISPRNYSTPDVPTWNYTTAHLRGTLEIIEDDKYHWEIVKDLVDHYETDRNSWALDYVDPDSVQSQIRGTVAFRVTVESVECKFKLSQNRPVEDRKNVIRQLQEEGNTELAEFMIKFAISE